MKAASGKKVGKERLSLSFDRARRCLPSALLFTLSLCAGEGLAIEEGGEATTTTHRLVIMHTNDLSGRLLPTAYYDEPTRGGFARLSALLSAAVVERDAILLDAGDALGDSPLSRFDQGHLVAELMGEMGYAAMAPGNHDFDYGVDTLAVRVREMGFPMLAANLEMDGKPLFSPWTVLERDGLRSGDAAGAALERRWRTASLLG